MLANVIAMVFCAALGFGVAWGAILLILRSVKGQAAHTSGFHHTHAAPIPRYGGLALMAAFAAVFVFVAAAVGFPAGNSTPALIIGAGALAIFSLGFWDDLRPLGAKKKLLGQCLIAVTCHSLGLQILELKVPGFDQAFVLGYWGSAFITVFWLIAIPNLINLIDGTDGLAGGIAFMLMCLLAYVAWGPQGGFWALCAVGVSGALLGFLRFNFPPARIYMGDGGAYLLGFLIAGFSLESSHKGTVAAALIAPLLALALPVIDVSLAIIRRGLKGLPLFRPDTQHIHHRLRKAGLSRTKTVLALYGVSLIFLLSAFIAFWSEGRLIPILLGILFLFIVVGARSFGIIEDWAQVGRTLGNSREMRRETQYALTLTRWLEMEAERCDSLDDLWADFTFIALKLGFYKVHFTLPAESKEWLASARLGDADLLRSTHELPFEPAASLEFQAWSTALDKKLFELLAELCAEAWFKSARKWQMLHNLPIAFGVTQAPQPVARTLRRGPQLSVATLTAKATRPKAQAHP